MNRSSMGQQIMKARASRKEKPLYDQPRPAGMKAGGKVESRVNEAGNYTKPTMRKKIFEQVKAGDKGGKPGQWSARKAQMLAAQYKAKGGGYSD